MPVQILGILLLACPGIIHMKEKAIPVGTAFALPAAKATTSYASGKEELIARKEVDKIKTPY